MVEFGLEAGSLELSQEPKQSTLIRLDPGLQRSDTIQVSAN